MTAEAVLLFVVAVLAGGLVILAKTLRTVSDELVSTREDRDAWANYALDLEPYAAPGVDERWAQSPADGSSWSQLDYTGAYPEVS
jgi:hypothetical protein